MWNTNYLILILIKYNFTKYKLLIYSFFSYYKHTMITNLNQHVSLTCFLSPFENKYYILPYSNRPNRRKFFFLLPAIPMYTLKTLSLYYNIHSYTTEPHQSNDPTPSFKSLSWFIFFLRRYNTFNNIYTASIFDLHLHHHCIKPSLNLLFLRLSFQCCIHTISFFQFVFPLFFQHFRTFLKTLN